jgi:hypothetical protein
MWLASSTKPKIEGGDPKTIQEEWWTQKHTHTHTHTHKEKEK